MSACFRVYREVAEVTRGLDPTRPITFACNKDYDSDLVVSEGWDRDIQHINACNE